MAVSVNLVVHAKLVVRKRSLATPAVSQNLEALVDQPLVVKLLECPEHTLGVILVQSFVVVIEVNPASLAGDVGAPIFGVLKYRRLAGVVELLNAKLFDFQTARNTKLTLGLYFGRKTVSIPTETALDAVTLHGLVARNHVFGVTGKQMPIVRKTVGKRRTVVENEFVVARALIDRRLKGVVLLPKSQDFLLYRGETRRRINPGRGRVLALWIHVRLSDLQNESLSQC